MKKKKKLLSESLFLELILKTCRKNRHYSIYFAAFEIL